MENPLQAFFVFIELENRADRSQRPVQCIVLAEDAREAVKIIHEQFETEQTTMLRYLYRKDAVRPVQKGILRTDPDLFGRLNA